jgi:transcriptional regulator with XRE-family HTH domain
VRKTAGLRAADLADLLGVSLQTVSSWENGKHPSDASTRGIIGSLPPDALANAASEPRAKHDLCHHERQRTLHV